MAITALTPDWTGRKKGIRYGIRYTQKWIKLFFLWKRMKQGGAPQ